MGDLVICRVVWSDPKSRQELIKSRLGKANYIYAIMGLDPAGPSLIRIGASANLKDRLRGYPILDFIPNARISYHIVSEDYRRELEPVLTSYFIDKQNPRPPHLRGKELNECVHRELRSIEYKVERLLLEKYKMKHGYLPPGNPMTGSDRPYLKDFSIEESGSIRVLDMPRAHLVPMELNGDQLLRLLW